MHNLIFVFDINPLIRPQKIAKDLAKGNFKLVKLFFFWISEPENNLHKLVFFLNFFYVSESFWINKLFKRRFLRKCKKMIRMCF